MGHIELRAEDIQIIEVLTASIEPEPPRGRVGFSRRLDASEERWVFPKRLTKISQISYTVMDISDIYYVRFLDTEQE
jgi:hypothetical protein